jgi:hypothetical protein
MPNAVSDFKQRADRWLDYQETLGRIPVNDLTRDMRVDLLREQLTLFTNIEEWNIFRTSLLAGSNLTPWQEDWLLSDERRISYQGSHDNMKMTIFYGLPSGVVHWIEVA